MLTQVVFIRNHFAIFINEASVGLCHYLEKNFKIENRIRLGANKFAILPKFPLSDIPFPFHLLMENHHKSRFTYLKTYKLIIYICSGVPFSLYLNDLLRYRNYYYCHYYFYASSNTFWVIDPNFQIGALTQHDTYNRK